MKEREGGGKREVGRLKHTHTHTHTHKHASGNKEICNIYPFRHSVCQHGFWYHHAFAETPQLNLKAAVHKRKTHPYLWMKSILNYLGRLMHYQFCKERRV